MWLYNNIQFELAEKSNLYGFVYLIENLVTGKKYIGRKYFTRSATKQVNGKKKKIRKDSGWLDYWSSSEEVKADVLKYGKENFRRTILHLCETRASCSYLETYEIFKRDALLDDNYYNSWVSCKIHKAHVKGKIWPREQIQQLNEQKQNVEVI